MYPCSECHLSVAIHGLAAGMRMTTALLRPSNLVVKHVVHDDHSPTLEQTGSCAGYFTASAILLVQPTRAILVPALELCKWQR